jgi:hypothetical protein
VATAVTLALNICYQCETALLADPRGRATRCVRTSALALVGAQAVLAVASRKHYTADVVVALIVSTLSWKWHVYELTPAVQTGAPSKRLAGVS